MSSKFFNRIRHDWENQTLAILLQGVAILIAIVFYILGQIETPSCDTNGCFRLPFASSAVAFSMLFLIAPLLAIFTRALFKRTVIGGFFTSILLASLCLFAFSISEKSVILKTSLVKEGSFEGPFIDLTYWAVFCIFVSITASSAIERIVKTWGQMTTVDDSGEETKSGVAMIELVIFVAIWGAFLSGAQQRILGAFVFDSHTQLEGQPDRK